MSANEIQFLNFIESIRKRPGMYIGGLNLRGFNELLKHVFEELQVYATTNPVFEMTFYPGNRVVLTCKHLRIADFASQLPLWNKDESSREINWLKVLIALSGEISITAGSFLLTGKQGDYETAAAQNSGNDSVIIDFTIDAAIFKEFKLVYEQVNPFLQQFAYLNPELKIISEDHSGNAFQRNVFHYPKGILEQLDLFLSRDLNEGFRLNIEASLNGYYYRIGMHEPDFWIESAYSKTFAGNTETCWGGSLEDGIVQGLTQVIKALAKKEQVQIHVTKKAIKKQFAFMASVSGKEFNYEGSTKQKLGMPGIKKDVIEIVYEHMMEYYLSEPTKASRVLQRFRVSEEGD